MAGANSNVFVRSHHDHFRVTPLTETIITEGLLYQSLPHLNEEVYVIKSWLRQLLRLIFRDPGAVNQCKTVQNSVESVVVHDLSPFLPFSIDGLLFSFQGKLTNHNRYSLMLKTRPHQPLQFLIFYPCLVTT